MDFLSRLCISFAARPHFHRPRGGREEEEEEEEEKERKGGGGRLLRFRMCWRISNRGFLFLPVPWLSTSVGFLRILSDSSRLIKILQDSGTDSVTRCSLGEILCSLLNGFQRLSAPSIDSGQKNPDEL